MFFYTAPHKLNHINLTTRLMFRICRSVVTVTENVMIKKRIIALCLLDNIYFYLY